MPHFFLVDILAVVVEIFDVVGKDALECIQTGKSSIKRAFKSDIEVAALATR